MYSPSGPTGQQYSIRRGERIIELCRSTTDAVGIIGEDVAIEQDVQGVVLEPICKNGQQLRFALLTAQRGLNLTRLQSFGQARVVTSYPMAARSILQELSVQADIAVVRGCIEAELADRSGGYDAAIELVQSGDSVRDNGLSIVADDLYALNLIKIGDGEIS